MEDDQATLTQIGETGLHSIGGKEEWCVTLLHHPEPRFMGRRVVIESGKHLLLGRDEVPFGEGGLSEKRISREHARIWVTEGGKARIEDLKSRNGTRVNEATITHTNLGNNDVVSIGGLHLLIHRAPAVFGSRAHRRLIGGSHKMARVLDDIHKVAPHDTTVLILGETGTGKELVARALHDASGRSGDFFAINCGGMPDTLLQSELFGHVRGAFSGADRDRQGLIEAAHGGTLFLDEIGDASPTLQVSLLRFLQEGEIRKIGSNKTVRVQTRILAATHKNLLETRGDNPFREDLYSRLSRWEIHVPPLRERKEDIPHLINYFLKKRTPRAHFHHRLNLALVRYDWPRNVRELEKVCERAVIEAGDQRPVPITPAIQELLAEKTSSTDADGLHSGEGEARGPSTRQLRDPEILTKLLTKHEGNVRLVSKELNVARNTLYRWFKSFEIDPESFRKE